MLDFDIHFELHAQLEIFPENGLDYTQKITCTGKILHAEQILHPFVHLQTT